MHLRAIMGPTRRGTSPGRRRRIALALGVTLGLLVGPVTAATAAPAAERVFHVVCKAGAARGDGSSRHAWTSLSLVQAHHVFAPGDRILLKRGTTCHGRLDLAGSGTKGNPIVIGAYGTGSRPVIVGGGTPDSTGVIQLDNVSYWTVQDLHITNTGGVRNTTVKRAGVLFRDTINARLPGLVAQRLWIEKVDSSPSGHDNTRQFGGISAQTLGAKGGFDGLLIRANALDHVGRTGIAVFNLTTTKDRDRNARVTGNRVSWARGDSIVLYGVTHGRIDHNVSAHGANMLPCSVKLCGRIGGPSTASAGIWPALSTDIRIDHNEVYGEHANAGDGEGIDVDLYAKDIVVEQNYLHDNEGGGVMFCGARDTTVRFNVIQHNRKAAFTFTCGWQKDQLVKNITITNNDVVTGGAKHSAYYVVRNIHPHPGTGIRFTNNVVSCSGACAYTWPKKPYSAGNTFLGTRSRSEPTGVAAIHGGTPLRAAGTGSTGMRSLGGYHPTAAGRAVHGVRITGTALTDFFGRRVSTARPPRGAAVR